MYVVGRAGRQHWQHVYTAVTRGQQRVYIIAEESQLRSAIARNSFPRKTRLKHFLQSLLQKHSAAAGETFPAKGARDSEGPGSAQPPALPVPNTPPPARWTFPLAEGWKRSSFSDAGSDEDPASSRGSKRTGDTNDVESPSKMQMVGWIFQPGLELSLNPADLTALVENWGCYSRRTMRWGSRNRPPHCPPFLSAVSSQLRPQPHWPFLRLWEADLGNLRALCIEICGDFDCSVVD